WAARGVHRAAGEARGRAGGVGAPGRATTEAGPLLPTRPRRDGPVHDLALRRVVEGHPADLEHPGLRVAVDRGGRALEDAATLFALRRDGAARIVEHEIDVVVLSRAFTVARYRGKFRPPEGRLERVCGHAVERDLHDPVLSGPHHAGAPPRAAA